MSPRSYIALLADATASRALAPPRRARLQADIRAATKELNRRFARALAARFAVARGDELQCLLPRAAPVWEIAHHTRSRLAQVDWVVACGRGAISTPLAPTAPEMDGPCFHEARGAMERAKRQRLVLAFGGFPPPPQPPAHYYSPLSWSRAPPPRPAAAPPPLGPPPGAAGPPPGGPPAPSPPPPPPPPPP